MTAFCPYMHMRVMLVLAVFLGACGSLAGPTGAGSGGTGDSSPTVSPPPVKITMADDHHTVTAHVGDHVQIALGEQYRWTLDPPDGIVLARPAVQTYLLVRGTQAIWIAKSTGTSIVRATGTAVCASGTPCPQLAVLFMATVDVVP